MRTPPYLLVVILLQEKDRPQPKNLLDLFISHVLHM